jgi:hypothetical protein
MSQSGTNKRNKVKAKKDFDDIVYPQIKSLIILHSDFPRNRLCPILKETSLSLIVL